MTLSVFSRLLQIQRVLIRHSLDEFVGKTHLLRPLRFLFYLSPATWFERRRAGTRGERLRLALEELGPIFMKLGQVLSTRRDLLPADIADELAKLQDRVPPFSSDDALRIVADAYGRPASEVFASFEEQPLAAATIAQVHTAKLKDGGANLNQAGSNKDVIVKIVRPGIQKRIERDLEVMYALADLALRYWSEGTRLRPTELVREYEKTILDELDLLREAGNAAQLKRNFDGSNLLYVPKVYWEYCRKNVMVMERIEGVLISNIDELQRRKVNIQRLSENGVEIFFTQVFRHNFFHADMHPGNIFVLTDDPAHPRYAAVDFGIVGTLDPRDQYYLAENLLAFFDHDYRRIAQLHIDSAWVPTHTRVDELESAVRSVCEPIFQKPLSEISFGQVLMGLFETARRFGISVQPQLLLLHKTLLQIEGLGRQLYPELDLWKTAQPIMKSWMRQRIGPFGILKRLHAQWPEVTEAINALPQLLQRVVQLANQGEFQLPVKDRDAEKMRDEIRAIARRRDLAILSASFVVGGMLWFALVRDPLWPGVLGLAAGLLVFWRSR